MRLLLVAFLITRLPKTTLDESRHGVESIVLGRQVDSVVFVLELLVVVIGEDAPEEGVEGEDE